MKILILRILPDRLYLSSRYRLFFGRKLNLKNPKTFNEKLQWLKLYDRKQVYAMMADKIRVKDYVSEIIGSEYIIPTIGFWENFNNIDFDSLPNKFVLKCNHDCGSFIICRDKKNFDKKFAKRKLESALKFNYYWRGREWAYKDIKPFIFAEEYIEESSSPNLPVYKIFTFSGNPQIIQTIQNDKQITETIDYFDCNWKLLDLRQNFPNSKYPLTRPDKLDEMLDIARKLSGEKFPFLRVDLYEANGHIYFSEFTFYSDSGFAAFYPEVWDLKLGKDIIL